jgi:hypothetical protein
MTSDSKMSNDDGRTIDSRGFEWLQIQSVTPKKEQLEQIKQQQ